MTFEAAAAYSVAGAVTILLRWMAARNRRSGWQRERNDVFFEDMMTWAEAKATLRGHSQLRTQPIARSVAQPVEITSQLLSLQSALNTNAGVRCEEALTAGHKASLASK